MCGQISVFLYAPHTGGISADESALSGMLARALVLHAGKVHPAMWSLTSAHNASCHCLRQLDGLLKTAGAAGAAHECSACLSVYARELARSGQQVQRYLHEYRRVARLPAAAVSALDASFAKLSNASTSLPHDLVQAALQYHADVANLARTEWTQFKPVRIAAGLALQALAAAFAMAICALLALRARMRYAQVLAISCRFHGQPMPEAASNSMMTAPLATAMGLVVARASVPFSNSLILGELQVTAFLMATCVLAAGGAALSRLQALLRASVARTHPGQFVTLSAWEQLRLAGIMAWDAVSLPSCCMAPRSRSAEGVVPEPEHHESGPYTQLRWRPVLLAVGAACAALLLPRAGALRWAAWGCQFAIVAVLARVMWLVAAYKRLFAGAQQQHWLMLMPHCAAHKTVQLAALVASALAAIYVLAHVGGVDRIGANPFQKSAGASDTGASSAAASAVQPWLLLAPVALGCSILAHRMDALSRRVAAQPAMLARFGVHVPWRLALGDALLALSAAGALGRALLPQGLLLRILVELDMRDDEAQADEAQDHHNVTVTLLLPV